MEQILVNLVAGALGGAGVGKASPQFDLGAIGNIISGVGGGGVLGQIVTLALPSVVAAAQGGNLSVGGIISQVIAGGAGGAILTAFIGAIKNRAWEINQPPPAKEITFATDGPMMFGSLILSRSLFAQPAASAAQTCGRISIGTSQAR
jgi:hypothetical protein